jgi:hypothetical protein
MFPPGVKDSPCLKDKSGEEVLTPVDLPREDPLHRPEAVPMHAFTLEKVGDCRESNVWVG